MSTKEELLAQATHVIAEARRLTRVLSNEGLIAAPPAPLLAENDYEVG